ncbi:MAG: rod-binding protein [Halanaerobiales bacterium]
MNINLNTVQQNYDRAVVKQKKNKVNNLKQTGETYRQQNPEGSSQDKRLKMLAGEFTSILMKQMFKTMRQTVPEGKLIDGGFSEDVFTDMLDEEISKLGAEQKNFNTLSRLLYEQLRQR